MQRLRTFVTASLVWATAASVLMASTPYVVCKCPNGNTKLFCFKATFSKTSSCCCSGAYGTSTSEACCCKVKPGDQSSCCGDAPNEDTAESGSDAPAKAGKDPAFGKSCCQKTLVQVKGPTLTQSVLKLIEGTSFAFGATAQTVLIPAPSYLPRITIGQIDRSPPPTDLITLLHHFTI